MTPLERLSRITTSLGRASELTLQRIETELGLTPRPESPDAGRPYEAVQATSVLGCHDGMMDDDLMEATFGSPEPMTPVSERGMHE